MGPTGRLVTIKRSGVDGPHFPLSLSTCLFGRGIECDIRIQLPVVSKQHCKIEISGQKATLFNFSATNPTQVNGSVIDEPVQLKHGDMITIVDRSFRYENESQTTEFPGQRREQVSSHQGTRSDFSSDPDGNVQDPNARSEVTEEGVSGPVGVSAAHGIPRASGEPGARKTPDVPSSALPGDDGKNAAGPTAGEFREDSSVTSVSGSGELTRPSTRCLEKCGENESPFRKLYESLKEELDVKSEKENVLQNRRRSGSRSHRTTDNGSAGGSQGAAQLRVSPKPGRRSGLRSQSEAGSASGDRGRGRTEARRTDAGPAQMPRDAVGPRVAPRELTKSESPAPCLQQNSSRPGPGGDRSRGGDSMSLGPQVSLGAGGGLSAPERILTRTQTQTATRDDGADKSRNTPEKALSKKRRSSVPVNTDMLAVDTDTQAPAPLSPLRAQAERKVPDGPLSTPEPLDVSNSAEDVNKMEGVPSKRRRVSFGGHLRPELFDENLPPNTPLKRGETPTKRRSLGTHTPAVLKKIIKEQPLPSGKDDTSEIRLGTPAQNALPSLPARTPTGPAAAHTHGARPLPSGPPCAQGTDLPRSGGRRSSGRPPRPSVGRSQLELLQAIHSKRRSGASEANLIVAKSWADVVRLSAKQAQTKVAKRSAQRPPSKRQRRSNTPKKPVGSVHHPSSTGHANSPCTIVIGKAHLEKVNAPARPCRMLNSFIFSRKADFNEDLSGLTEMFKTPAKEKVQMTSICPTTFSNSEDLLRKMFAVPRSEEETLLRTAKNSGETVSPSTRNAPEEPSEKSSINPAFRRQRLIVNGEMGRAPPEAEPLRPASSAHKLRRSAELGNAQTPGAEGEHGVTEASAVEDTWGGRFGRTPSREQKPEGELKESARSFETCRKSNRSEENSEKAAAARRSRALELRRALRPEDPVALGRPHDTDPAGARGSHGPLRSPAHPKEPGDTESRTATVGSQPPEPEPFRTPAQGNMQVKTPSQKVSVEVLSAQRKRPHTPGESTNTPREPEGDEKDVTACEDTPEQKRNPAEHAPGSRRRPRTPKRKVQALEDLAGFTELLQTPDPTLEPVTDDKINNIPCRSPQVDPVITSTVMTRGLKTLLQKVDVEEALLALRKSPRAPGKTTCSPREPAGDEKVIEFFQATPELKPDPAENAAGSRRRPRTPKRKVQHLEDLAGFRELFQTPKPLVEPVTDVKTKTPCKSPQAEPVITSTVMTGWLKTPPCKVDVDVEEALSALRKSPRIPRGTTCSPREPADDEKITKAFKATPEQKLELTENVTGSRRRPRTPKRKAQALEELAGFRELLQTPDRTVDAMTEVKTRTPCKSPQAEPVTMPTGRKSHLKTSLGKVEMDEDISALRNPTPTPGETTHSHGEAGGDDKDISHLKQTPEQKVDPAENAAGSKRRPRTPKRREQPLEELAGFTELLQTPDCTLEPVTYDKTQIPCRSPQVDPVITSTIVTKGLKTLLQKVDVEEALLALRKSPRAPGGTTCSPREPAGDEKVIEFFQATPEQKLDPAENAAGSRRRPRTPKRKVQHLEDLAGFRELFQSPDRTLEPVTDVKTKTPCKSPQAEPVTMPTGRKSRLKTSLGKVDVEEDISALKNPTPTPGETTHSHREAEGDDKDISHLKQTPEQKVDPVENAAGSKRRPRTPKRRVQSLGDLTGFRELFQSPDRTVASMTDDKSNNIPSISPKPEPINTNRKSHLKTPLEKVDIEEELSAPRKPMPTPGGPSDDKEIKVFKATPEQKLDPAENAARSKRRPRTPKRKVQSLGDLTGFRELFQTPDRTLEPMTDVKTKIPCRSPQAEPLITSTVMTRGLKTLLQKVDVEEALSALRKSPRAPGGTTYSPREPAGDEKITKAFKATPEQKVDPAENAARSKRRPRTPKRKVQSLGDLTGFTELLQTSDCTLEPVTYDKTQIPCRSPQVDPVITSTIVTKGLKTLLQKVDVEEALLALRKSPRAPGGTTCSPREPAGDEKVIEFFQATPEQKLDPAENAAGSRRRPRTPKRKVQHLEDLAGFRELFQTPDRTLEPVTDVKTKTPCKSPQAEPVTMSTGRKSRLKTSLGKVDVEEDISALRNPTPTPGETTHSHREAGGDDKDISHLTQTPEQKVDPAENAARSKRRPRTPKRRVQSLGDLTGFRELFQSPDRTLEPMTDVKTKIPCRSPQAGPLITSTVMTRGLKTLLQKVDVEEALSALRKSPRAPGGTTYSPREPAGDEKITKAFKATPEQKLELTENVTGSRRRPRTPKGKAQALEDLAGIEELFRTPDHTVEPVTDDKTKILCRSPRGEPINTSTSKKSHLKTPLEKVDIEEEPLAPRKPTPTPGGTTDLPREPGDDKDIRAFKATPEQKLELTEIVIGSKRKPRTPKGKAQALEDLAGIEELFRTPDRTVAPVTDDKAQIPCKSPQAEPAGRKKRLKAPPGKVDIEVEPSALKKPTRTSRKTTSSHREPKGDDEDIKLFKKTSEQKADSAENVTRSKRRPRAPKEMARAVGDLAGLVEPFQTSDHTDGPGTDDRAAKTLRQSSRPELGIRAASKKRQGKAPTREEDVEEEEEPAAPRKSTRTSGKTTRSHRAAVGGNKKASVSQQTVAQNLGPAGNAVGSRRRLRTRTEQPPPPEDRPGCQELIAAPGQDEAPGSDAESARRDPAPTRDKRKPAKTSRRVPRALSVEPTEDPARSPNGSVSRSPTREHGKDENLAGAKRLRTRTCPQDAAEDPPLQKRQRTAPRDRRPPPGPAVTDRRSQRLLAERTDLPSSTVSVKNKRQKAEVMAPPEKSMSLRSRRPNKTSGVEQGPGFTSAEKAPTRRNVKKTPNTSQEMKLRNLEDGAEDPAPGGQAQGGGARLRPGRQRRVPAGAAGEAGDSRAGIHGDAREEKEGAKRSGRGCLRPRKVAAPPAGDTLESEPKQRVTRSAKRSAESLTKENDNVCVRKMRTRSHRDNEDI